MVAGDVAVSLSVVLGLKQTTQVGPFSDTGLMDRGTWAVLNCW